jgi:hypothetical protein
MNAFEFIAMFGDEQKMVNVRQVDYTGNSWHILLDGKEWGVIYERLGGYYWHEETKDFTADDLQAFVDRITEHKGEPGQLITFFYFSSHKEYRSRFKQY